jgi:predicted glycosyltransferase
MNILIDISHPAHVHLFKHAIRQFKQHGHKVIVTIKEIAIVKQLLEMEQIEYTVLRGSKRDSMTGKAFMQIKYDFSLWKLVKENSIDIGIGSSVTIAHVSKFSKMKSVFLDDDDDNVEPMIVKYVHPFCNTVLSPIALSGSRKTKQNLFYQGSHELAYLHPNRFTPDPSILETIGLQKGDPFFVMRFNAFKAHHDSNVHGLSLAQKLELVKRLERHGKVLITTERNIEPELAPYQMTIPPDKVHHLLYYATLFVGDSQTMTSEAAILGTPAFRCNSLVGQLAVIEELEHRYHLAYGFTPEQFPKMIETIDQLLEIPDLKAIWQTKRAAYLSEKIDVTAFLVWFIEHYPESENKVLTQPAYPLSFQ